MIGTYPLKGGGGAGGGRAGGGGAVAVEQVAVEQVVVEQSSGVVGAVERWWCRRNLEIKVVRNVGGDKEIRIFK
ncbi:hypothetical protein Tco_0789862 [Tanacetum coccineum]